MLRGLMDAPLETVLGATPLELLAALALAALAVRAVLDVAGWVFRRL
jgi:hypothetical protein